MPTSKTFSGFDASQQSWFEVPNEWTEISAEISSLAELKVVQYVMRHTWGHPEDATRKRISSLRMNPEGLSESGEAESELSHSAKEEILHAR